MKIWISPIRGLYDRANIAPAMYVSDNLALSAITTIRLAWLLARLIRQRAPERLASMV